MPEYAAFLRAINVGGRVVKMDRLRKIFCGLGFDDVETVIASGNVLFTARVKDAGELEAMIAAELQRQLGFRADTFVRTPIQLRRIVNASPFAAHVSAETVVYVAFLATALASKVAAQVRTLQSEAHKLELKGRELFWLRNKSLDDGKFSADAIEKTLAQPVTVRNMTTVRRILGKFD